MITSADAPATILVVDDDEAKRYIVTSWLRRAGHTVLQAATGGEALAAMGTPGPIELVVLDVNLPDMTGYDVCRRIKSDPRTAAIPVIQASATAITVADRAQGLTEGADAYLTEPTEPEELLAVVLAALRYYRARQRAERTASLLAALNRSTLHVIAAETFDGLARAAAAGAAEIFAAPAVLILELPDGQVRRMSSSPQRPEPAQRGGPAGLLNAVATRALGAAEANAATMVPEEEWLRLVPDSTLRGDVCLAAARIKPDRPPVVLTVAREGIGGQEEQQILRQLVQSVALAVEALRAYAEEHLVALTLQRSFLPAALPAVPGLAMSYRYIPASEQVEVGGDFYEALPWGDKVLVVIGDVQGHSLHAATVMGELRHALRAFAVEGHSPLIITGLVNEVLRRYHPGIIATLCLALLDPASGELEVVNCGHIPILLVTGTGATYLGEGGLLLGLPMHEPRVETACLPAGGTMLLITDGLVEERGVFIDVNLEKLRVAAQEVNGADVEAFSNHLTALFGPRQDDVAMIAVRRLPAAGDPAAGGAAVGGGAVGGAAVGGAAVGGAAAGEKVSGAQELEGPSDERNVRS